MDINTLFLGILVIAVLASIWGAWFYFKPDKNATSDIIYTTDQVLGVVYVIIKAISEDDAVIEMIYAVLTELLSYARILVEEDALDKQHLLDTTFEECRILGIELTEDHRLVIASAVELIYIFVSR